MFLNKMEMLKTKKSFRKEFKRQLRYAIAAAVGFLIVFAWRDAIIESTKNLIEKFTETTKTTLTNTYTAIVLTIIGVLIIIISSKFLREKK